MNDYASPLWLLYLDLQSQARELAFTIYAWGWLVPTIVVALVLVIGRLTGLINRDQFWLVGLPAFAVTGIISILLALTLGHLASYGLL